MTAAEIIMIIGAIGGLVTIIGTAVVGVVVALRKMDEIKAETQAIAGHVNGAATKSVEKIDALHTEVAQLKQMIADQRQSAALLAQGSAPVAVSDPKDGAS